MNRKLLPAMHQIKRLGTRKRNAINYTRPHAGMYDNKHKIQAQKRNGPHSVE